ncbi:unnamed protein product [Vitrella brassicaformis CCMP3155]|uniref:Uncharacterized protein n=2 Tax=Vitrella brassicaformis TaxID=1169539 RepID=A0A0G4FU13_VITBC|nr:unnamed protein product [Vitrella brassicaformis CCMP3155]|eukprot:CEM18453.1 unnamed protein product [Vitrella brassicaformis CCMP3155]
MKRFLILIILSLSLSVQSASTSQLGAQHAGASFPSETTHRIVENLDDAATAKRLRDEFRQLPSLLQLVNQTSAKSLQNATDDRWSALARILPTSAVHDTISRLIYMVKALRDLIPSKAKPPVNESHVPYAPSFDRKNIPYYNPLKHEVSRAPSITPTFPLYREGAAQAKAQKPKAGYRPAEEHVFPETIAPAKIEEQVPVEVRIPLPYRPPTEPTMPLRNFSDFNLGGQQVWRALAGRDSLSRLPLITSTSM